MPKERFLRRSPVGEWSRGARRMGGVPPLGDRAEDRKLVVMDSEAEIVRAGSPEIKLHRRGR